MKKIFLLLFIVSAHSWALTLEELDQKFIGASERGPLRAEHLTKIESALHDLGLGDYLLNLQEKLKVNNLNDVANYVHACQTEKDTLGYYRRGTKRTMIQTIQYGQDIFAKEWDAETAKLIEKAYRHQVVNNNSHLSLIIMEWPIICIRPNQKFGSILSTFVHEVTHYVNDDEKGLSMVHVENETDYVEKYLMKAGGEFEAYQSSGKILNEIEKTFNKRFRPQLMTYFENGEVIDSQGLKNHILLSLGYKTRFINQYRQGIVEEYNSNIRNESTLKRFRYNYEENERINKHNLEVNKHNLEVYKSNIRVYENNLEIVMSAISRGRTRYNQSDIDRLNSQIESAKQKIESATKDVQLCKEAIKFYQNMVTFTDASLDQIQRDQRDLKEKIDRARSGIESSSDSSRGIIIR